MVDQKITELNELTDAANEDLLATVDSPSVTPVTKKITRTNFLRRPYIDVKDYGAVFDGVTDDKAAIQLALDTANSAGGKVVVMPRGTAMLSGALTMYANCTLRGQGKQATKLQTTTSGGTLPGGALITSGNSDDYMTFEGFEVVGNGEAATSGTGIYLPNGVHSFILMRDLWVHDFPEYGIRVEDPILSSFEDLRVRDNGLDGLYINIGTSCFFKTIYGSGNNRSNFHLKSHTYSTLTNCASEYSTLGYWLESSSNIVMDGCGGEVAMEADTGTAGIVTHHRLQSCSNITVNGNYSSKFAYLHETPAYHWYITASRNIILNNVRGKAPLGGADPGEIPTNTIYVSDDSDVTANNLRFTDVETGRGINGTFNNESFNEGDFTEVTAVQQDMYPNKGYIANSASKVELMVPPVARVGNTLEVVGAGSGGFRVVHGVGKQIHYGEVGDTDDTAGGGIDSSTQYQTVKLVCTTDNTDWTVVRSLGTLAIDDCTDVTLGKTSNGDQEASSTTTKMVVSSYTATDTGVIRKGTVRCKVDAGSANVKFVVYSDVAGAPGKQLAESDILSVTNTTEQANDFTFSGYNQISIVDGTEYWLGLAWEDPDPNTFTFSKDNVSNVREELEGFTWPTLPLSFGTPTATFSGYPDAYLTLSVFTYGSPSESPSVSKSVSPSVSPSASISPSASESASVSPSSSESPSPSA